MHVADDKTAAFVIEKRKTVLLSVNISLYFFIVNFCTHWIFSIDDY